MKWAETKGICIEHDGAVEIVVFSGSISPAEDQVVIGIITQPSFEPQNRTSDVKVPTLGPSLNDQHLRSHPAEDLPRASTPPNIQEPEINDPSMHPDAVESRPSERPPQKRRKVGQYPGGTQGAETDGRLDLSMLGQQPQVKIVRDLSNPTFQTGEIIGLDEHDTLYVQKGYTVMMLIRYRIVETPKALEEGPITSRKIA